jgi:hypothetical protein
MKPVEFEGMTHIVGANQKQYNAIPVHKAKTKEGHVVTCWELTDAEVEELVKNKRLWIVNLTFGRPFMPMDVQVKSPLEIVDEPEATGKPEDVVHVVAGRNSVISITVPGSADIMREVPTADILECVDENCGLTINTNNGLPQPGDLKLRLVRSTPDMPFAVQYAARLNDTGEYIGCTEEFGGSHVTVGPALAAQLRGADEQKIPFSEWLQQAIEYAGGSEDAPPIQQPDQIGATEGNREYWFNTYYVKGKTPTDAIDEEFENSDMGKVNDQYK